jgi:drug/metabolite transporter (DMT)-like permease
VADAAQHGTAENSMAMIPEEDGARESGTQSCAPPGPKRADFQAYLHVMLMILIGSTTAPAARFVVRELPLNWIPFLRFALATVCLVPVVWWRGELRRLIRQDGWRLLLAALLCVPINQGFFLSATRLGPTSHVALFYATCPLVVLLLAWGSRLERPDLGRLWGVLLSVAGIIVIGIGHFWEQGGSVAAQSAVASDLLLVGAVVSWGGYIAVSKPLILRHGAITVLAGTFLAGCVLAAPIAFAMPPGFPPLAQVSASAWLGLAFLGLFVTPFGWAYQNLALRRFDASQVATLNNASPLLTVVWGMWLFGETLSLTLIMGGVMTLGGIYWTCRPRRPAGNRQGVRLETCVRAGRILSDLRHLAGARAASEEIRQR